MKRPKARGKNLDDTAIKDIVEILDGWVGKLTWELLVVAIAARSGSTYTRQALHVHERIHQAYVLRKSSLGDVLPSKPAERMSNLEVEKLIERVDRLASANARLTLENTRYAEQFAVWAYNAHNRGLTETFLSQPLPAIDREATRPVMGKLKVAK